MSAKLDLPLVRSQILSKGAELRFHINYSRSGLTTKCRLWHHDGIVLGKASGGGYDKGGTALGQAIQALFAEEIKSLPLPTRTKSGGVKGLYGLYESKDGRRWLEGGCGKESMLRILEALGYTVSCYSTSKYSDLVVAIRN